jgi:hypothetical protein
MSGLKSYIVPRRLDGKKNSKERASGESKPMEMVESSLASPQSPWYPSAGNLRPPSVESPVSSSRVSTPTSLYPQGDFRNATMEEINDIKCEVMVNWLHSQQEERLWTSGEEEEGVVLKKSRGMYTCTPADLAGERGGIFQAVQALNVKVRCIFSVSTRLLLSC